MIIDTPQISTINAEVIEVEYTGNAYAVVLTDGTICDTDYIDPIKGKDLAKGDVVSAVLEEYQFCESEIRLK